MKKIIAYLLIAVAGISLNGCYDLDTYPGDRMSQNLLWKTEEQVKEGIMGVYSIMKHYYFFGGMYLFDGLGETACVNEDRANPFIKGTVNVRTSEISSTWTTVYEAVQRANLFLRMVSDVDCLDTETKAGFIGEAKFLRALYYFHGLNLWGGIPYYDETTNLGLEYSTMKKPRCSAGELRSYILSDLDEAIATLPVKWDDENYGRATKGAAYALRGKVYLYNKEWKNAIADFEEVVYNKSYNYGYALDPDYARIFKLYNGEKSPEMIFSIQNKGGVETPLGMSLNHHLGTRCSYGSCWNNLMPSVALVDMYEYPDGKPFNWEDIFPGYNTTPVANRAAFRKQCLSVQINSEGNLAGLRSADTAKIANAYRNRDPRLTANIITPYSWYKGWYINEKKDFLFALDNNVQGILSGITMRNEFGWITYFYRKFVTEYNLDGAITDRGNTPFEFPLIRYADVLLMLSEAYNEDGQLSKAVTELNKVRARPSVHMPGLNSGPVWMAVTSKEQMAERIRKERALELVAEGHRYNDLRRWGWNIASAALSADGMVNIYGERLYARVFEQRNMLWPISDYVIEKNETILQNPGW